MISFKMILMGKSQKDSADYVSFLNSISMLSGLAEADKQVGRERRASPASPDNASFLSPPPSYPHAPSSRSCTCPHPLSYPYPLSYPQSPATPSHSLSYPPPHAPTLTHPHETTPPHS